MDKLVYMSGFRKGLGIGFLCTLLTFAGTKMHDKTIRTNACEKSRIEGHESGYKDGYENATVGAIKDIYGTDMKRCPGAGKYYTYKDKNGKKQYYTIDDGATPKGFALDLEIDPLLGAYGCKFQNLGEKIFNARSELIRLDRNNNLLKMVNAYNISELLNLDDLDAIDSIGAAQMWQSRQEELRELLEDDSFLVDGGERFDSYKQKKGIANDEDAIRQYYLDLKDEIAKKKTSSNQSLNQPYKSYAPQLKMMGLENMMPKPEVDIEMLGTQLRF